jgi:hypothetical protein
MGGQQAQRGELARRVREQVDADTELPQLARLLEDFDTEAGLVERQRGSEAADTRADDDDGHAGIVARVNDHLLSECFDRRGGEFFTRGQ